MSRQPVLYRADWILPVASPPLARGELLLGEDGRIAAVAPGGALDVPTDVEVRELGAAILLPGLVNVHAHPELSVFRGALEDLPFRDWILRLVGAKRRVLRDEDSEVAARWSMVEAMRAGITTLAATEASGAAAGALEEAGLRGIVYQEVFGPDPTEAGSAIEQLEIGIDRLQRYANERVRIGVSPHAPYTVSDALYQKVARLARTRALPMAVHIAESGAERALVTEGAGDFAPGLHTRGIDTPVRGRSSIDLLMRLGVLDLQPLLIHCVDLDREDIETIARTECSVAHCPIANAKLGHGVAPLMRLREAGVRVGIGTDSVGSNNRLDLLEEARVAALLQRAVERSATPLGPADLLRLCTIDGARALGLAERIGTLEPGKEGDFCAVSLEGPHTHPSYDPVATLFHSARGSDVILTAVAGRIVYERGEHRTLDAGSLRIRVGEIADRLREAL